MRFTFSLALMLALPAVVLADPPGELIQVTGGKFAVRFPGKPKEITQDTKTPLGTLKVTISTFALADGSVFIASFAEYPAEAVKPEVRKTLYEGVVKGLLGKDGKVVGNEKEIEIGKEKGLEVVIDKGKLQTRFRLVVKDTRLIQLGVLGSGEFITGKDATAFLDSIEFK